MCSADAGRGEYHKRKCCYQSDCLDRIPDHSVFGKYFLYCIRNPVCILCCGGMLLYHCFSGMFYPAGLQKAGRKNGDCCGHQRRFRCQHAFLAPGTAGDYETSSFGGSRQPVCGGHRRGGAPLFSPYCPWPLRCPLWHCGKRHRCCIHFRQPVCCGIGQKAAGTSSCHCFSILWNMPDSVWDRFPCAGRKCCPLSDSAGDVQCLPAWVQPVFHLCHFYHTGTDAGAFDGEGDVLCIHAVYVCAAGGADHLWSFVRPIRRQRLLGIDSKRGDRVFDRILFCALFQTV